MITIGLDMLGGDFAPEKVVQGLHYFYAQAINLAAKVKTVCFGDEAILQNLLLQYPMPANTLQIVHAPDRKSVV